MVNYKIITLMKRRIDELTDDELVIIKAYCDQKVARRAGLHMQERNLAAEIVRQIMKHSKLSDAICLEGNYGFDSDR